jgi:hypothetical protein
VKNTLLKANKSISKENCGLGVGKIGKGTRDTPQRSKLETSFSSGRREKNLRINIQIPHPLIFQVRIKKRRVKKETKFPFNRFASGYSQRPYSLRRGKGHNLIIKFD